MNVWRWGRGPSPDSAARWMLDDDSKSFTPPHPLVFLLLLSNPATAKSFASQPSCSVLSELYVLSQKRRGGKKWPRCGGQVRRWDGAVHLDRGRKRLWGWMLLGPVSESVRMRFYFPFIIFYHQNSNKTLTLIHRGEKSSSMCLSSYPWFFYVLFCFPFTHTLGCCIESICLVSSERGCRSSSSPLQDPEPALWSTL